MKDVDDVKAKQAERYTMELLDRNYNKKKK